MRVKTIYDEWKTVKVKGGVQHGEQIKLEKEGFCRVNSNLKGNHVITIKIKVPRDISEEERALYQQLKNLNNKVDRVV